MTLERLDGAFFTASTEKAGLHNLYTNGASAWRKA